ncbi:MAG: hypothetical protein WBZ01_14335 [Terriglobales bacterium]
MEERNVNTWEEFKVELANLRREHVESSSADSSYHLLFRGQENSCWLLTTTLDRRRERMLFSDYYRVISKIRPQIESVPGGAETICNLRIRSRFVEREVSGLRLHGVPASPWFPVAAA